MDGLSIITGIAITVFLLFYLAFNIEKEHKFLKILTIFAGLFMLILIPQTTIELDSDCSISDNGTYRCYMSNGTLITDYGAGDRIGENFTDAYIWYIVIFGAYIFVYFSYTALSYFNFIGKGRNKKKKKKK